MKIGLIIYGSLETVSGGYLYDRQLVATLQRAGHAVEIIALPWRTYRAHLRDNFDRALRHRLLTGDWDILLQDELNHPSLFGINVQLRGRVRYPIISIVHHLRASEHHPRALRTVYREVERAYLRSVDGFIFNSETTRQTVHTLAPNRKPSIVAYPSGSRFVGHPPKPVRDDVLRLIFVGNVTRRKGLHTLLDALQRLPDAPLQLDVVGALDVEADYATALRARADGRVRFWGRLSDEALATRLSESHALVVPSQYEGFGIVYMEGMAFGLAVLATHGGAAHEIITHGINGFLIMAEDVAALVEHLQIWLDEPLRLESMRHVSRERFEQHPTWEDSMREVEQFLRQMLDARP